MFKNSRRLKVSYHSPDSRSCAPVPPRLDPMPLLRLQGRWLAKAGFAIGSEVRVEVTDGRLVLEVIEPEPALQVAEPCLAVPRRAGRVASSRVEEALSPPVAGEVD
jgi:hypothetical protein